jgi:hypothetical protein
MITLGFMIYGKNQITILEQPIGIKGNIQIITPSEIIPSDINNQFCEPCTEFNCICPYLHTCEDEK